MLVDPILDKDLLEGLWADAAYIPADSLAAVLEAASDAVIAYAPPFIVAEDHKHKAATILQAKHIWSSFQGNSNQEMGADGYLLTTSTWNLVLEAQRLLRPKQAPWKVGF